MVTVLNELLQHIPLSCKSLSIQVDGASENWSNSVLAFGHLLVQSGRFEQVTFAREYMIIPSYCTPDSLAGLPVGHTHEDIDQIFSVVSRALQGGSKKEVVILHSRNEFISFLQNRVSAIFYLFIE